MGKTDGQDTGDGTGTGRWESLGKQEKPERPMIETVGSAGPAAREGETIYVIRVCDGVWAVL